MALYTREGKASTAYAQDGSTVGQGYGADGGTPITIMSYNVGAWYFNGYDMPESQYEAYYKLHTAIFDKNQPEYVGIQEYYTTIGDKNALEFLNSRYNSVFTVDRGATAGRAVASKYEINEITDNPYINQYGEQRYYIKGYITVNGKKICVISTHLNHLDNYMYQQAAELAALVANEEYCIVVGDFNADINTESGYNGIVKPFTDAGYIAANGGEFGIINTHHENAWRAIDAIFVTPNIKIVDVLIDKTKITDDTDGIIDHLPLIAHILID